MTEDRWEDWKEEREGSTLEERQEQAAATLLRQMAVSRLRAGADPEVVLRQIREAARLADDGEDPAMASYLRAIAMVLSGEEPSEFGALISQLFRRRQAGDYEFSMVVTRAEAQSALDNAQRILQAIVDHLAGEGLIAVDTT